MIGVAGCGRMGAPMLSALRAAGLDAGGFDIRPPSEFGVLAPVITRDVADFAARVTASIGGTSNTGTPQTPMPTLGCTGIRAISTVALTNVTARARFHGMDLLELTLMAGHNPGFVAICLWAGQAEALGVIVRLGEYILPAGFTPLVQGAIHNG